MTNKAILIGYLGGNPEMRRTQNGNQIASFSVATNERWTDGNGEKRERTDWHRVVIFNENIAKVAEQFLKKGSRVYLEGKMIPRKWTDKRGNEHLTTEVVLGSFHSMLVMLDKNERTPPPSEDDYAGKTFGLPPANDDAGARFAEEIPF